MKRTHFFVLQKQTFFSSKKGKHTEQMMDKFSCVHVFSQGLSESWPGKVTNREFMAGKRQAVCLIPQHFCCLTAFSSSKGFPLDLSFLHADSRKGAWRSSWYSFTLSKLVCAHFQSPVSETCLGCLQGHGVLVPTSTFPTPLLSPFVFLGKKLSCTLGGSHNSLEFTQCWVLT